MADESNRDEELRKGFSKLRARVLGALRSKSADTPAAEPIERGKDSGVDQEQAATGKQRQEDLTQERMDAMRDRTWTEKSRLTTEAYAQQGVNDREQYRQALRRQAVRKGYEIRKAEAADANRVDAFLGDAKKIPDSQIDNRPGEKFALRRTKGMARKRDPNDTAGSSP